MAGHRAATYLKGIITTASTKEARKLVSLSAADAQRVQQALTEDAKDYYFSGLLSFVEALRGPQCGLYSWATVKFYYSVFYTLRAILALNNVAIFYISDRSPPWVIRVESFKTANPIKEGNTHKAVLDSFEQFLPRHQLVQPIGADNASDWLKQRREEANYRNARFPEPGVPPHFAFVVNDGGRKANDGVRRALQRYTHPQNDMDAFDPVHAMIAYPYLALRLAKRHFLSLNLDPLTNADRETIFPHCRDERGSLPDLLTTLDIRPPPRT